MRFLKYAYFLIIIGSSLVSREKVFSQKKVLPPQFKFTRIDHEKGLQNAFVNDIVQDSLGFIWIATNDGLYKYDGLYCKAYRHTEINQNTIPNNHVQSLFLDNKNQLWIMTDNGLCYFNYDENRFTSFAQDTLLASLSDKSKTSMDQFMDGSLIIGTYGDGMDLYDFNSFQNIVSKFNLNSELETSWISKIKLQLDSVIWAGTFNDGLIRVSLNTKQITYFNDSLLGVNESVSINDIFICKRKILVASNHGLLIFNWNGKLLYTIDENNSSLQDHDILSVFQDSNNIIWIGSRVTGLYSIESSFLNKSSFYSFTNFSPSEYEDGISHRTISTIFEDKQGNIWLGTHNGGANVFNPKGEAVITYQYKPLNPKSLSYKSVYGICEDHNGILWVGTDGGGVDILNPFTSGITNLSRDPESSNSLSDNAILTVAEDSDNNMWLGTYNGGLNKFNKKTHKFSHFSHLAGDQNILAVNDVRVVKENKNNGHIWIGTNGGGLYEYNPKSSILRRITNANVLEMDIRAISFDKQGNIWLGTYNFGLNKYHPEIDYLQQDFSSWYPDNIQNTPTILSIDQTEAYLWLGTRFSGLVQFDKQEETFKIFSASHGLANSTVRAIVVENEQKIWVSTNVGISLFNVEEETFTNFDASNGLTHGHFNDGSGLLSKNGYIAFGSIHGLNIFYPERLTEKATLPPMLITDISVLNETISEIPITRKSPLDKNISIASSIKLPHTQNTLTFMFTAQDMPISDEWGYWYMMENYDAAWNNVRKQNSATYRNLPPGEYMFKIQIADGNSLESNAPLRSISVLIAPPWWGTIYAYIVYSIIAAIIIFILYRYNLRQVKLKNSLFYEKKLRQQEHDLMEEKIRFYTNFSHELKTPLTLILGPVQDLLQVYATQKSESRLLRMVQKNANLLLLLINRLLEFRKIESEKIILHCARYDLNNLAKEEYEFFQFQAARKGVSIHFKSDGPNYAYFDHEKMQIVLNNLLSNAVKFTDQGKDIDFCIAGSEKELILEIKDSGTGIRQKELKSIFTPFYQANNSIGKGGTGIGLSLCKNLIELHGGRIIVESKLKKGTTFTVKLLAGKKHLQGKDHVQFMKPASVQFADQKAILEEFPVYNIVDAKDNIKEKTPLMLVVDDNEDVVHYLESIFYNDFKLIASYDGKEGIDHAVDLIPDIIISDVMMPQKNGIELCEDLKANQATSHIPIILLTAKDSSEAKVDGYNHGADAYIVKPFDSGVLKARVKSLLENRQILSELYSKGEANIDHNPETVFLNAAGKKVLELSENNEDNVPTLSKELGFSRTSLYRKIKAVTGLSINGFIRKIKIEKAAELIINNRMNVSEVAFSLGFEDLKYFRKCFKEQFGVAPSEYQNKSS